jgi:hypothetical protein
MPPYRTSQQELVTDNKPVSLARQIEFGLVALSTGCSAALLRSDWAITAAHCVEIKDAFGQRIPDPDKPGQFMVLDPRAVDVIAAWGPQNPDLNGPQIQTAIKIVTYRPYDIALIRVASRFIVHGENDYYRTHLWRDRFPDWERPGAVPIWYFGRGINVFAHGSHPASSDGLYRVGCATTNREEEYRYWYPSGPDSIAGGDSGGPSFAWDYEYGGWALMGVHTSSHTQCVAGQTCGPWPGPGPAPAGYDPWTWVAAVSEAADAPVRSIYSQIYAEIDPRHPGYVQPVQVVGEFPKAFIAADELRMASFRHIEKMAANEGLVGGFPNFHQVTNVSETTGRRSSYGGTIFVRPLGAEKRDITMADLGNAALEDFSGRMRAAHKWAMENGYIGGFPTFFHANTATGTVCGTVLLKAECAEFRDVPLSELGNPSMSDIEARFRGSHDYAVKNGFVGGFPTLNQRRNWVYRTVGNQGRWRAEELCGTVLLRSSCAEWRDILINQAPG